MSVALRRAWAKDLDTATLYELLKLRVEVFVVEQATPYPELDGRDLLAETRHFWLEGPDGEVICTLRLMEEHAGGEKGFRIGDSHRVCEAQRSAQPMRQRRTPICSDRVGPWSNAIAKAVKARKEKSCSSRFSCRQSASREHSLP